MARKRKTPNYYNEDERPYNIKIKPKSENQKTYLESLKENKITFVDGPAGVGKTLLATLYGLSELLNGKYHKLIISRPTVESGSSIGYLPGNLEEKLNPYLLPIYDILDYNLSNGDLERLTQDKQIEIVPFSFMRGRNFINSYIILDEIQNCTYNEIILALTRFGSGSKMVITGDCTQSDLPDDVKGGMIKIMDELDGMDNIGIIELYKSDIVREPIVKNILEKLENAGKNTDINAKQ